ncbi:hypothetical protein EJ03DRAFT_121630 [Teratosphaeria nubilosa]|uniref:Uncharacterized protein n=1 Tax=Teratosphaeria nubilosa TaxID=161662 RepID=A0A6G1L6X4_9PEZI|nr:hypothetical protein EJ03DRAFT_121630 [Teratosphaeria nubilosa]
MWYAVPSSQALRKMSAQSPDITSQSLRQGQQLFPDVPDLTQDRPSKVAILAASGKQVLASQVDKEVTDKDDAALLVPGSDNDMTTTRDVQGSESHATPEDMMDGRHLKPIRKQLRSTAKLLDEVLLQRYLVEHEQTTLDDSQELLYQHIDSLLNEHQGSASQRDGGDADDLRARVRLDLKALRDKTQFVKTLRGTLNSLEFELNSQEESLQKAVDECAGRLRKGALSWSRTIAEESSDESSDVASTSDRSEVPTLLERYYDQKGNVSIVHERLGDFEDEYQEARLRREILVDRGEPIEGTDDEFHKDYARQRDKFIRDLQAAEQMAAGLRDECLQAGISVPNPPESHQEILTPWASEEVSEELVEDTACDSLAQIIPTTEPVDKGHIDDWISGLDLDIPNVADPSPITSLKSSLPPTPTLPPQLPLTPVQSTDTSERWN